MDWEVSSNPYRCENSARKENSFIPEGTQILSQKKVEEFLNYKEPMRITQNMETRIERSVLPISGDCVSLALMRTGSPTTVHVQRMRVMSTEINLAVPTTANGYQIYCPPSNACLMHEGRNIFIIQEDPADLFITSKICDTDMSKMKPKHTMKSHVLNPEAKEFIPFNFREPQTNCKSHTDVNDPINEISNKPMEYTNARDKLFPCSNVASEDFKMEINHCSTLTHEKAPLIVESTSSDNESENTCTCPVSSNLNDDEQTKASFASSDKDLLMMALTECLSLCQFPESELKVTTSRSDSKSESEINSDMANSELCKNKPLVSLHSVKEESGVVEECACPKNEGSGYCMGEEPDIICDIKNESDKCQNLEGDDCNIVFVASDEETENYDDSDDDDDWEDDDEISGSSEEEDSSDEIEEEENEGISESDDDDVTICFTVDDTQESDNESDVQDDDDDDDFEIDEENDNGDEYTCELFQVEFNDDEVRIPMDGLGEFIADLLSQTANSQTHDGMVDFLNNSDELDDVDSSGLLEEREEILQANKRWNEAIDLNWCSSTPTKVTFSNDVEIHSADECCRKGPWEICARDRIRFQRRIEGIESILNPILSPEHRSKVLNRLQTMEKK